MLSYIKSLSDHNLLKESSQERTFSTGDIVAFSSDTMIGRFIRMFTGETYSHMALVWVIENRVFTVEALDGKGVLIRPLSELLPYYHLKTVFEFTKEDEEYMLSKVGSNYSYLDAILSGLGFKTKKNNNYQCAEFVSEVYGFDETHIGELTPGKVMEFFMSLTSVEAKDVSKSN